MASILPTFGPFTLGPKAGRYELLDASFSLTAPTSDSSGRFTFASDNSGVATVTNASTSSATTSNLLARYDASVPSSYTLSGSNVTQWNDLTGNGYHLTANGTGPTITTINSVTAFNFNSGYGLYRSSVPLNTSITVFMVAKYSTSIVNYGNFMHHGGRDNDWSLERDSNSSNVHFQSNNVNNTALSAANNTNYIWIGRIIGNTREFWRYSDTVSTGFVSGTPVTITSGNKTLYVGKSDIGEGCNSTIGEILYYNASLSNADVSANLLYLQNKWFNNVTYNSIAYVNLLANGTANITATQDACGNYTSKSVSSLLTVYTKSNPTYQSIPQVTKRVSDASFSLTSVMTGISNSSGAYTFSLAPLSQTTILSTNNMNNVTGATFNGGQYQSNLVVGYAGNLIGWDEAGSSTVHIVDVANVYGSATNTPNYVIMFWTDNIITQTTAVSNSNVANTQYVVTFKAGPAVYQISGQATQATASDGIVFEVLRANNTVLATSTYLPGAWAGYPTLTSSSFNYTGDGSGDVRIRIKTVSSSTGRFGGCVDDVVITRNYITPTELTISGDIAIINAYTASPLTVNVSQAADISYNSGTTSFQVLVSNQTAVTPTLGTFTVSSSKTYGDASFSITTRPTSDSSGAITYTSSNTSVATIDTCGNWITLVGAGDVSFNASQAAVPNQFTSASKTSNTLTVALGTSTFSASTFSIPSNKSYGDASFAITTRPSSNSGGAVTYSSNNTSVATIDPSGNWITLVGAGDVSFNATQAATSQYNSATKASNTLTVALGTPTLSSTTFSVSSTKTYGDASFAITTRPTSNSSGAITYTSSNTSVATIDTCGNWITLVGAGDVSFNASQVAVPNQFTSASKTSNTLTVALGTSTFSASTFSIPSNKYYGDASFAITTRPSSNSGGAVTYTSSNTSVATIDTCGNWITLVGAGDVSFNASQAATSQYASATKTSNTLTVALGTSTFSASTFSIPSNKSYGDASFAITTRPSSNSGGAVTYTSSNTSVATIDTCGNWITLVGAGDVSFNASQAATSQYASATKTSNTLTVALGTSTFSASTFSIPSNKSYGDASFAITTRPSSNSGGEITYSSSNTSVATIDACGNWITLVGAGDVSFNATQAATSQYASATKTSNTLTVALGTSTFSASTFSIPSNKSYGDASFAITTRPSSNSGGAVTYTSSNTSVATIDTCGNWITLVGTGDVSFNATQAATSQYASATKTSNTLTVALGTPTLSSTTFSVSSTKTYGDASFAITTRPSSNSGGEITYSSSNTSVATIDACGNWITLVGAGDVSFNASQSAVPNKFTSASKASNTLTVSLGTPTLSLSTFSVASTKAYGDASFAITTRPSTNSTGAVTYTSSNTAVATIDTCGNWITLVGTGDVSFNASQAAVPNQFTSASKESNTLTVSLGTPTLSSSTFSVASSKVYGDASFVITTRPTSNSDGAITYTSNNTAVATIDACGNWINIVSVGDVSFNATQAAVSNKFTSATRTSNTLTVSKATPTLTFSSPPATKIVTDAAFTVTASSDVSPSAVTYSSSNTAFATVGASTGLVTLTGAGTVTITATQASTALYNSATASCSIVISAAGSTLAGQTVSPSTSFSGVDLSGASFAGTTLSGVSFSGATLTNVNFSGAVITGTDFTNANISGATNLPAFSTVQKLQLLKNINNASNGAVQVSTVSGSVLSEAISATIDNIGNLTFAVVAPTTLDASSNKIIAVTSASLGTSNIYIPVNTSDVIKINGILYRSNGVNILDANNTVVNYISIDGVPFRVYAGSFIGINALSSLNALKVNGIGLYDAMKSVYLLASGTNSGAGSALSANTIASFNSAKINGDGLYDIINSLLLSA